MVTHTGNFVVAYISAMCSVHIESGYSCVSGNAVCNLSGQTLHSTEWKNYPVLAFWSEVYEASKIEVAFLNEWRHCYE